MSRFEEIEAFVRVVDAGSITSAAEQMRIAKSAVSRRIKELEMRLGVQLLKRSSRQQTLTETGQAIYDRSVGLLADWEETESLANSDSTRLSGRIRLSAPRSFGTAHLNPAIIDFMKLHPEIEMDADFTDRSTDLVSEGYDLAIRIGNLVDSSLIAKKLANICMVAVASPDLINQHEALKHPNDLKEFKECVYGHRRTTTWSFTDPNGHSGEITLRPRLFTTSGEFLTDAAIASEGILKIPRFIVYKHLQNGSLIELFSEYDWGDLPLNAIYPPTRHLSARVRALIDFLADRFKGTPYWDK